MFINFFFQGIVASVSAMFACLYSASSRLTKWCLIIQLVSLSSLLVSAVLTSLGLYKVCQVVFNQNINTVFSESQADMKLVQHGKAKF